MAGRFALIPVLGRFDLPFLLAYPAVAAAAWAGGRGPAILCSLLSILAADYFFLEPVHNLLPLSTAQEVSLLVFFLASLLIASLGERSRRALAQVMAGIRIKVRTGNRTAPSQ
jgi:K+-sensing histidine kinase KdpD